MNKYLRSSPFRNVTVASKGLLECPWPRLMAPQKELYVETSTSILSNCLPMHPVPHDEGGIPLRGGTKTRCQQPLVPNRINRYTSVLVLMRSWQTNDATATYSRYLRPIDHHYGTELSIKEHQLGIQLRMAQPSFAKIRTRAHRLGV